MRAVIIGVSILILVLVLLTTGALIAAVSPTSPRRPAMAEGRRDRIRLFSHVLFAWRTFDAITIDCTLTRVEHGLPPDLDPPEGLPFTLRLRCPDTAWFAVRVEELLNEWADESREVLFELSQDNGKVRTMIANGESSVHLELAGAAGLDSRLTA